MASFARVWLTRLTYGKRKRTLHVRTHTRGERSKVLNCREMSESGNCCTLSALIVSQTLSLHPVVCCVPTLRAALKKRPLSGYASSDDEDAKPVSYDEKRPVSTSTNCQVGRY